GGEDGAPRLSFTLYLAAHDRYEAALVAAEDGGGIALDSDDASCTLLQEDAEPDPLPGAPGDDPGNGPPGGTSALATGAIEIIELGVLPEDAAGLPPVGDCAALTAAFDADGGWAEDANAGLSAPSGGLSASVEVVDEDAAT